jgi:hypothetical protein
MLVAGALSNDTSAHRELFKPSSSGEHPRVDVAGAPSDDIAAPGCRRTNSAGK